jgi:hypothetical protein
MTDCRDEFILQALHGLSLADIADSDDGAEESAFGVAHRGGRVLCGEGDTVSSSQHGDGQADGLSGPDRMEQRKVVAFG